MTLAQFALRCGRRLRLLPLAPMLALSACLSLGPGADEAPQLYTISPASAFAPGLPSSEKHLVIETPLAPKGLDTTRIAVRETAQAVGYYANARWIEPAPRMFQAALIESFRNSGRVLAVSRRDPEVGTDYSLKIEFAEFAADISGGGAPLARLALTARLVSVPERRLVASERFEQSVMAKDGSIGAVAAAFDEAAQALCAAIVAWTVPALR